MDKQIDREMDILTDEQTEKGHIDRQTHREMNKQTAADM
jgi:hypothetical protein